MVCRSDARRFSARWLCSIVISSNLRLSPGERCATIGKSASATTAIFGYPPTVGASAISTIGAPSPGIWIDPGQLASDGRVATRFDTGTPFNLYPVRSDAVETLYSVSVSVRHAESSNMSA